MTPRTSVRAEARELYCEMAKGKGAGAPIPTSAATPLPNPPPQGGREQAVLGGREQAAASGEGADRPQDLTARIRALYETSSVPVREIAQIAGVTERTLYKYVEKHGWKKRYAVLPRGREAAAANCGRRWQHADGFAPAKGSGGRFIRRDDIGKPFAKGLKALDPQGRARALARCDDVEPLARAAQQRAEAGKRQEARLRAFKAINRALKDLADYRDECKRYRAAKRRAKAWAGDPWRRPKVPRFVPSEEMERAYKESLDAALDWLHALQREEMEAQRAEAGCPS